METEEKRENPGETETVETPADEQITVEALKELLEENKKIIKGLTDEMVSVKKENAKLLARMDVSEKVSADTIINDLFNKYK